MLTNMLCFEQQFVLLDRVAWETGLLLNWPVEQEINVYFILYPQWATCFGSSWNHQATILNLLEPELFFFNFSTPCI